MECPFNVIHNTINGNVIITKIINESKEYLRDLRDAIEYGYFDKAFMSFVKLQTLY